MIYLAIPNLSDAIVEVATSAAVKTVLQVATPSTTDIRIVGWGVSFDGIVAANPSGIVTLIGTSGAATVTTLTPTEWESDDSQASLCVGGAALTGYNGSVEGTITTSRIYDGQNVHPQTGYSIWFPTDARPKVKASRFLRIRCLFSVDINVVPWIAWKEPA